MLDQKGGEAFMRAERRAMDDIDRMVRPIFANISEVEGLGRQEVELVGGYGIFGADGRLDHEVDLGTVEVASPLPSTYG